MQIPMGNAGNGLGKRRSLPKNVTPIHYDLWIEPDLSSFTFKGKVSIQLKVLEESTAIVLNTFEIEVQHVKVLKEGKSIGTPTCSQDIFQQQLTVLVGQKIPVGSFVTLQLSFHGIHNMQKVGLFGIKYNIDGKERRAVQTQMQPTSARRAWPCFDEPALKATWAIQLSVERHLMCIGNMTIKSVEDVDGRKLVTFHTTPKMSSYLLALVIGEDLHYVESKNWRVPMRAWAESKESAEKGRFALEVAEKAMKFYEEAFEYKYPLPKLDFATLPNAMLGAMENWGLLLYATDLLLYDPKVDSQAQREKVTSVHMHEMAHQWFSNLVTTKSWDATWLNEGFATWIELYSRNILYPEFHTWSSFISNGLRAALELDSLRSSHPIESIVEPGKEGDVLDRISYEKGCAIIRMISGYLGEKVFLRGVARYTNDHAFGSTTTDDLWTALTATTGISIKNLMDPWIRKKGYPVIFVHDDGVTNTIGVEQHRFLKSGDVEPEDDLTIWPIPLNIRTTDKIHHALFIERSAEIRLPVDFFVVNPDHTGFYRVAYSKPRLEKLATQVKAGLLTVDDRAGLLLDTGALAAAGVSKTSGLLTLGKGFAQETTFAVWRSLITEIRAIRSAWMFQDLQTTEALRNYQYLLMSSILHQEKWDFSGRANTEQEQLRVLLFENGISVKNSTVLDMADEMFSLYRDGDKNAVDSSIRVAVFGAALRNGNTDVFNFLIENDSKTKERNLHIDSLKSLGFANSKELLQRAMNMSLDTENFAITDLPYLFYNLHTHPLGAETAWEWFKEHGRSVMARIDPGLPFKEIVVQMCVQGLATAEQHKDAVEWFERHDNEGYDKAVTQVLEAVKSKADWVMRDHQDVQNYLQNCMADLWKSQEEKPN